MKVLVAESKESPADLVRPVAAALSALDVERGQVDLGRVGETGSRLGRVVQAIMGEAEAGQLVKALTSSPPDVALAFDAGALAALTVARDRRSAPTAILGVVPDLAPGKGWAVNADRFAAVDDEAAVALGERGVDGARVAVTGPIVPHALHEAARATRAAARAELKLPGDLPVVLVDARGLSTEVLGQVTLQLSLFDQRLYILFDAGSSAEAAALIRKQVPGLGLKGKLFGETATAARLWRCADALIGRATARAVHAALALGTPLVALEPRGEREQAEAQALADRRMGSAAGKVLLLAAALEPFLGRAALRSIAFDGAAEVADLAVQIGNNRDQVLAETQAQSATRAAPPPPRVSQSAAADPEDLEGAPGSVPELDVLRDQVVDAERRAQRELDEARAEAEKWEQRKILAEAQGDTRLAEQAGREADRKRARMHLALEELARIAIQKGRVDSRARPAAGDDVLGAFKKKVAGSPGPAKPKTVDDELADLKRRMDQDKNRRR